MPPNPKVFISYSHDTREHMGRVLTLSDRLRKDGVDCHIDQYEMSPHEGWPRWTGKQIELADFVLVVCSQIYHRRFRGTEETGRGLGVKWEGAIITQELYDAEANNTKFIPVSFSSQEWIYIPTPLRGTTHYELDKDYDSLYRILTDQPAVLRPKLGKLRPMPPLERKRIQESVLFESRLDYQTQSSGMERATPETSTSSFRPEPSIIPPRPTRYVSAPQQSQQSTTISPSERWKSATTPSQSLLQPPPRKFVERSQEFLKIGRDKHWDREDARDDFFRMITQEKTGDEKKDKQKVLVLQGKEVGLDSLVDRFEEMCEKATTKQPILYAKINLSSYSDYYNLALDIVQRLSRLAGQNTLTDQETMLVDAFKYVNDTLNKPGLPPPDEFAQKLIDDYLAKVASNCTIVLLLQSFDKLVKRDKSSEPINRTTTTSYWLMKTWLRRARWVEGMVILLTGEIGLEDLKGEEFVSHHDLPPLAAEKLREWATQSQDYGFDWFTNQEAKIAYEICNGNPEKFRKLLDYTNRLLKVGAARPESTE